MNNIPKVSQLFTNNEAAHLLGGSIDIQIKGFENNLYNLAKDIQKIAKSASQLEMVFSEESWIHINHDLKKIADSAIKKELPEIISKDIINGIEEKRHQGFQGASINGRIGSGHG